MKSNKLKILKKTLQTSLTSKEDNLRLMVKLKKAQALVQRYCKNTSLVEALFQMRREESSRER